MHLALYNDTIVFDQATKLVYIICWVHLDDDTTSVSSSGNGSSNGSSSSSSRDPESLRAAYDAGKQRLQGLVQRLSNPPPSFAPAQVEMALSQLPAPPGKSNMTKQQFLDAVLAAKEYILVSERLAGSPSKKQRSVNALFRNAGALSWWAMPLWSWRTCSHKLTPPPKKHVTRRLSSTCVISISWTGLQ
jgi:hypothetical protein